MAFIQLLERRNESSFFIKESLRVTKNLLYFLDINGGSLSIQDYNDTILVKDLIKWIEKRLRWQKKIGRQLIYKYETEPFEFTKKKLLPMLKRWNKDMQIDIVDY